MGLAYDGTLRNCLGPRFNNVEFPYGLERNQVHDQGNSNEHLSHCQISRFDCELLSDSSVE